MSAAPAPAPAELATGPAPVPTFKPPPPPFPPPPPGTSVQKTPVITLNNIISDGQIVTNLYLMCCLGILCFVFFICFRRGIKLYQTRLYLANVAVKPPVMSLKGHRLLWSWLVPIFTVSDHDMVRSCGLDSLMIVRVAQLGTQLFFPMTVLGCVVLLPMYTKQNYLDQQHMEGKVASPSTAFSRATMSNIPRGSALFWVPFVYVYIVLFYGCWLLRRHYKEYARLRTQYIIAGEVTANDWHEAFLANTSGRTSERMLPSANGYRSRGASSNGGRDPASATTKPFRHMFSRQERASDPGVLQLDEADDEVPGSAADATSTRVTREDSGRAASVTSRPDLEQQNTDMPLLQRLANRRHERSVAPSLARQSRETTPPAIMPYRRPSASLDGALGGDISSPPQNSKMARAKSFLDRAAGPFTNNPAAGLLPLHGGQPLDDIDSTVSVKLTPGSIASVRAASDTVPPNSVAPDNVLAPAPSRSPSLSTAAAPQLSTPSNYVEQVFNQQAELARRTELIGSRMPTTSNSFLSDAASPPSEIVMDMNETNDICNKSICETASQAGTSKYETERPKSPHHQVFAGQTVYKWWQAERDPRGQELSGKPNVWARKVVNTVNEDGATVGVMAQQYVVLVEGVPDPQDTQRDGWHGTALGRAIKAVKKRQKKRHAAAAAKAEAKAAEKKAAQTQILTVNHDETAVAAEEGHGARDGSIPSAPKVAPTTPNADSRRMQANRDADEQLRMLATATSLPPWDGSPMRTRRRTRGHSRGLSGDPFAMQSSGKSSPSAANDASGGEVTEAVDFEPPPPLASRQEVVNEFFTYLFPGSFQIALPVLEHKAVDQLLYKWDNAASKLEVAEAQYEASELESRPMLKVGGCCCCGGQMVDAINHWAELVRDLETKVGEARQAALRSEPTASFFVFFNDQAAAATAAQVSLQNEDGREFRVSQAPGPEEVNWPTLWKGFGSRNVRRLLVLIPIALMIIFPIGIFAGSISQLSLLLCGSPTSTANTKIRWDWYCTSNNYLRKVVTGVLPPLILTFWQGIVVPRWFYYWCQAERRAQSFTQLDQRILSVFFWWSVISVFIGAMLGGSIFSQFRVVLAEPGRIPTIIGTALPTSSNFFINYVIVQALAIIPFRYMFPHMGVFPWIFRACGFNKSLTQRQELDKLWPHSARGSKEVAFMILIFVIGLAYAAVSPIILPVALLYFCLSWTFWRYAVLYFFERCYESGGRLFEKVFSQVMFCLFIFEAFTAAVFIANSAWYQGSILLVTGTLFLYEFHQWTVAQFVATKYVPLESAIGAPLATVDPLMYIPPALRHGCAGWYPEVGKAWEAWNATVYTW